MKRYVAVVALLCAAFLATACATKPAAEPPAASLPRLCALLVGVGQPKTPNSIGKKDVEDFVNAGSGLLGPYRSSVWKTLVDEDATREKVIDGLNWIESCVKSSDLAASISISPRDLARSTNSNAVVFFSGHSVGAPNNLVYFLPWDADQNARSTGINGCEIAATMQRLPGSSLLFVDTDYAGRIADCRMIPAESVTNRKKSLVMFFSSSADMGSLDLMESKNGAFTRAVVEGLSGKAGADATGHLTYKMLDAYVAKRVKELTKGEQKPVTVSDAPDFPIKVIK